MARTDKTDATGEGYPLKFLKSCGINPRTRRRSGEPRSYENWQVVHARFDSAVNARILPLTVMSNEAE